MRFSAVIGALALALAASLHAQDVIPKVEYLGGHAGMDKKVKGSLLITASEVRFLDEHGAPLITVPMRTITSVEAGIDRRDASVGSKLAFGILAKSRKDELVTLSYETSSNAEGLVFRTDRNMSASVVAKIRFRLKHGAPASSASHQAPDHSDRPTAETAPMPDRK